MRQLKVGFAGTPEFARHALEAILQAGYPVPVVLTQPDRPAGRGKKLTPSPVKQAALKADIPVLQPQGLRLDGKYATEAIEAQRALEAIRPDVLVVAAYGLILPPWVLTMPRLGCLNIHASLLPRWRGAAPIQRAIEAGDSQTGITIMQMDEGLDTGDMLMVQAIDISPDESAAALHDRLSQLGASLVVSALDRLDTGDGLMAIRQPVDGVTYAAKLDKAEAVLDLSLPARTLARKIRAFNPVPGASLSLPGVEGFTKVWRALALDESCGLSPGSVVRVASHGIDLACGEGVLRLQELQRPGGKRQPVEVFVQGWSPTKLT